MVEVSGIEPLPPECDSGTLPTELYPHCGNEFGGATRDRTADLLHAMQALSQLSYNPKFNKTLIINLKLNVSIKEKEHVFK